MARYRSRASSRLLIIDQGGNGGNGYGYDNDFLEELQEYLNQRNNGQRTYGFGN